EKVRREIAIMKKINHPNVVQLKEVMDDENSRKIYLVLEYLERGEVKWQRAPGVPLMSISESMKVFRDVVLGLEYLHYQGIVHRDIKPANLLIAGNGAVKISDFGVSFASSLKTGEQDDYDLAKSAGTPAFLAPELCGFSMDDKQHPKINYKIDIWALGVTLYCFLFGKLPFWAKNEFELFDVICHEELDIP
ncbi:serine/threonine-protein kinase, partial [Cyberlindnera jadinii NRRL Y-1542]